MKSVITSDKFLLWLLRCLTLPLSVICLYYSFGIYCRLFNGTSDSSDAIPALVLPVLGGLMLFYFIVLWTINLGEKK